jgi:hypothetical protein
MLQRSEFERCTAQTNAADAARELLLGNNTSPRSGLDTAGEYKDDAGRCGWGQKIEFVRSWESVVKLINGVKRPVVSKGVEKIVE